MLSAAFRHTSNTNEQMTVMKPVSEQTSDDPFQSHLVSKHTNENRLVDSAMCKVNVYTCTYYYIHITYYIDPYTTFASHASVRCS